MGSLYLSQARYVAALERIRGLIIDDLPLVAECSIESGNRNVSCSWGLCSEAKVAWPDAEDHLWPDQFIERGRVAAKYLRPHHLCPIDSRKPDYSTNLLIGCFITCRVFQEPKRPTQGQVIDWYDIRISQFKK